jgi:hypothetical protein
MNALSQKLPVAIPFVVSLQFVHSIFLFTVYRLWKTRREFKSLKRKLLLILFKHSVLTSEKKNHNHYKNELVNAV